MSEWRRLATAGGANTSLEGRAARQNYYDTAANGQTNEMYKMLEALRRISRSGASVPTGMTGVYAGSGAEGVSGQSGAGNVILNQVIEGQKKSIVVPLKPTANGDRVGDIGGGGSLPYIEAINRAMNKQSN